MTTTTRIRACVTCADSITVTARNPNRRFCSRRCRVANWHARNRASRNGTNPNPNTVPDVVHRDVVRDDVAGGDDVRNAVAAPNTVVRCPHCRRPVTVLTWLLPPAAAHVTTPPVPDHG